MTQTFLFSAILLACATSIAAPKTRPPAKASESDCARAKKAGRACSLVFEGDDLHGDRPSATGSQHRVLTERAHPSLIRLRTSFHEQIIRTANEI